MKVLISRMVCRNGNMYVYSVKLTQKQYNQYNHHFDGKTVALLKHPVIPPKLEQNFFGDSYCVFEDLYRFIKARRSILDHQKDSWIIFSCLKSRFCKLVLFSKKQVYCETLHFCCSCEFFTDFGKSRF